MTTREPTDAIRLSGLPGLLAAVPVLLGFEPSESVVVVCMHGRRHWVGPVARVDLPPGRSHELAARLVAALRPHAEAVALLCYTNSPSRPPVLDDFLEVLAAARIEVLDVITVRDGIARSSADARAEAGDPGCAAARAGDPQVIALRAAAALSGRAVLPDRETLRRSVAGPSGTAAARAAGSFDRVAEGLEKELGARPSTRSLAARARRAVDVVLDQTDGAGRPSARACAELAILLADTAARDETIARAVTGPADTWLAALIATAHRTPDDLAAPVCSVLAVVAYRFGDGALAQIALDRVFAAEPCHRLGRLLFTAINAAMPPDELARLAAPTQQAAG